MFELKKIVALLIILTLSVSCSKQDEKTHVILIGIDGLDWQIIRHLWSKDRLPNFKRLAEGGSSGLLMSEEPSFSPCLWTTAVTGRPRAEHGITDFIYTDSDGVVRPINSKQVRAPRLWDIFSAAEISCAIVNWWATWPAQSLQGIMVSDYFWPVYVNKERGWFAGSAVNFDFPDRTYPAELLPELKELIVTDRTLTAAEKKGIETKLGCRNFKRRWFWPYCRDLTINRVCRKILPEMAPRFTAVYFQGVDVMEHWFWPVIPEEDFSGIPEKHRRDYGNAIYGYYEFMDEQLAFFLDLPWKNKVIILHSDHGFKAKNKDASRDDFWKLTDTEQHAPNGVIFISGPMIEKDKKLPPASIYDIFPTILYLMGQPLPQDIPGNVIRPAFKNSYLTKQPAAYVDSYGFLDGSANGIASPMDEHIIENLKSLGYLQ